LRRFTPLLNIENIVSHAWYLMKYILNVFSSFEFTSCFNICKHSFLSIHSYRMLFALNEFTRLIHSNNKLNLTCFGIVLSLPFSHHLPHLLVPTGIEVFSVNTTARWIFGKYKGTVVHSDQGVSSFCGEVRGYFLSAQGLFSGRVRAAGNWQTSHGQVAGKSSHGRRKILRGWWHTRRFTMLFIGFQRRSAKLQRCRSPEKKSFVSESTHGAMQCEKVARAGWFESASTVR